MKKRLSFTNNENGFFYPYVLFIVSILFVIIMANISIYTNEIQMTHQLIEQTQVETLVQMGLTAFKEDFTGDQHEGIVSYQFPPGRVDITFSSNEKQIRLKIKVETNTNYTYTLTHTIRLSSYNNDKT
ncbi:MAG TPA: competence type IV pilus minor pilin ComGG [Bacillota bacterium]